MNEQFNQEQLQILAVALTYIINNRPTIDGISYRDVEDVADRIVSLQEYDDGEDETYFADAIELHSGYWDCECKTDYIHARTLTQCGKCGATQEDSPDSRLNEVKQLNKLTAILTNEPNRFKLELKGDVESILGLPRLRDLNEKLNILNFTETYPIGCNRYFDDGTKSSLVKATVEQFGFEFTENV